MPEETTKTQETETNETPPVTEQSVNHGETHDDLTQQIVGPVLDQINNRMDTVEQNLEGRVMEKLNQKIEELKVPQHDAGAFLGGTPDNPARTHGTRTGESPLTSRPYSYFRMMQVAYGVPKAEENAKVEMALHRQLEQYYEIRQFKKSSIRQSFLVPFGSGMLPPDIDDVKHQDNDAIPSNQISEMLADPHVIQRVQSIQQGLSGTNLQKMQQALSMFDDSALGIFTDSQVTGELIELVRKAEVFPRLGVREVTLPPNGFLPLGSQTGAATGFWVGEAATVTSSEPSTGRVDLRAKKAAGIVVIPNELFRFSTRDTEAFIRMDLARVLALLIDLAGLEGTGGTNQPLGIINRTGVVAKVAGTTGANGDTLEPNDPSSLMADIEENDHDIDSRGFAWVMRGKLWQNILNRRAAAVGSGDQEGPYLFTINREDVRAGMPAMLHGHPVVKSGQVSNTRVKGSGTDLTYLLGGIPDDIIIGRIGVLEFTLGTEGTVNSNNLLETDQAAIRAIEHADFAMRHEDSWIYIDNIDSDLPSGVI